MLSTDQVLARGDVLGDAEGQAVLAVCAPGGAGQGLGLVADGLLVDLEPLAVTLVGGSSTRRLGHVDLGGTRVLHLGVVGQLDRQLGAGGNSGGLGLGSKGEGAQVAAEVVHVRGHVVTGVLPLGGVLLGVAGVGAGVLEGARLLAVDNQSVKDVVSRSHGSQSGQKSSTESELHFDGSICL